MKMEMFQITKLEHIRLMMIMYQIKTVKDLITDLKEFDENTPIFIQDQVFNLKNPQLDITRGNIKKKCISLYIENNTDDVLIIK